ncbi:zinc-dependent metalloprotease [Myxococcota bacterium]|nr:zinc-dependent metalloprotease [Myxococcota bacterium]
MLSALLRSPHSLGRLLAFFVLHGLFGCAEPVQDVNRVQGNYIRKADLEGEWYMLTTVVDVPPTRAVSFAGETGKMERVRFEFRENELVAYRAYPLLEGADTVSTGQPFDGRDAPLAAWPVQSHFDIMRDYNTSTGEQSNVIDENTADRLWFEREYARVDWSVSDIRNFDFVLNFTWEDDYYWTGFMSPSYATFVSEEEGGPDAFYREADAAGATHYFDVLGKWIVDPNLYYCSLGWLGEGPFDCAAAEVLTRTSFMRLPAKQTYEAYHYDDQLMSRFGYFRSEMYTYDEQRGVADAGRQYLINRHNIWKTAYDDAGELIPIPARETRTVPYYLSPTFPDDEALDTAAVRTMQQWDDAARRAVAAAQQRPLEDIGTIFTLCHNPVSRAKGDDEACGADGFAPRMGDLRYSVLHWVDTETMEGLLGYGPAATDPLTGEIISGKAHVYGAAVNTYATYATDVIRFFNGELDEQTLIYGDHFTDDLRTRIAAKQTTPRRSDRLDDIPVGTRVSKHRHADPVRARRTDLRTYDASRTEQRLKAARDAGAGPMRMNDELRRALEARLGGTWESAPEEIRTLLDPVSALSTETLRKRRRFDTHLRAHLVERSDLFEPNIEGIVEKYKGRTDYDAIWRELRAEVFASTAEHEVGHTLGLRHNFQGSYDSLNYFDEYWDLRAENLNPVETLGDLYDLLTLTPAQSEGMMRQKQYSSIMDYGMSWANDINGIGKYDAAAIAFGYTAGVYPAEGERCETYPAVQREGDRCLAQQPGLIEVFKKSKIQLRDAGRLLGLTEYGHLYEDPGLPSVAILERQHYTTLALAFPDLADFSSEGREFLPYAEYLEKRAAVGDDVNADRPVRVPYMFCSDEWESALLSCRVFDQGADPYELTKTIIDEYRAYYWFVNFRRGRNGFLPDDVLYRYWDGTFGPLSDIHQFWYLAPTWDPTVAYDDLLSNVFDVGMYAGFNLFGEALSTPPYGTYCEGENGNLIFLTDSLPDSATRDAANEDPACVAGARTYSIAPGVGRRRFSRYDNQAGYYLESRSLEAGHYFAELAAILSLVDFDARIIGAEGDAGTYAIGYYDVFRDEMEGLLNAIVSKDYRAFAPRARLAGEKDPEGHIAIELEHRPPAPFYDYLTGSGVYFNPETGEELNTVEGPLPGPNGLCDACTTDTDCAGHTGALGGVYCVSFAGEARCMVDCTGDDASCPDGTTCYNGNCLPDGRRTCEDFSGACSESRPLGRCPMGSTCEGGECVESHWNPVVETDASFMVDTDIFWFGFLYTTASFSTRFNDNFNVFRPGTADAVESDPAHSERVAFTDPVRGITYAAVQPRCDVDNPLTRETPLCGACVADMQCDGYTGRPDGSLCAALAGANAPGTCLKRCTGGQSECPDGHTCSDRQLCEPDVACPEPSPRCALFGTPDTGAVQLVKRGQALTADFDLKERAYWADSGDGPDSDRINTQYWRAKYELENHLDLLETLRSTFEIFGGIF